MTGNDDSDVAVEGGGMVKIVTINDDGDHVVIWL